MALEKEIRVLEIEAASEAEVEQTLKKLNLNKGKPTTLDVSSIYNNVYNIDWIKIPSLKLDN